MLTDVSEVRAASIIRVMIYLCMCTQSESLKFKEVVFHLLMIEITVSKMQLVKQ
jgi:hypothetical protein